MQASTLAAISPLDGAHFYQHSTLLAYRNMYSEKQRAHMEHTMRCMQLFAVIGAPPGLSNEHSQLALEKKSRFDFDQSTCSSRCRSGSCSSASHSDTSASNGSTCASTGDWTTVIIRNISSCTRQMLLDFLDRHGFQNKYDLVYLPMYFKNKKCFPFAFVNFVSESHARDFQKCATGCRDAGMFGDKAAEVRWSECQGLQANIESYRNSSVMHPSVDDEFKPLLFKDGEIIPFPKPTKAINELRKLRKPKGTSKQN